MSTTVRIWITIMLVSLIALTGIVVIKIMRNQAGRSPVASRPERNIRDPDEPVDLDSYEMIKRDGEKFSFGELRGQVWIASTFFSSCLAECKDLNTTISTLRKYPEFSDVKVVSISVQPSVDTPNVLAEYAQKFEADEDWFFLNGKLSDIKRFGREVPLTVKVPGHDANLVLFDRQGRPQGFYVFYKGADIVQLRLAVAKLKEEEGTGASISDAAEKRSPHGGSANAEENTKLTKPPK